MLFGLIPDILPDSEALSYYLIMFSVVVYGFFFGFLQMTLYGTAGPSPKLTSNLMVGVGIGGVAINLLRAVLYATINSLSVSSQVFYYSSTVFMFFCTYLSYKFVSEYELH